MKIKTIIVSLASLLLSGCLQLTPNPKFSHCANTCSSKQDTCMVNASTASNIDRCNNLQNACIQSCEKRYSRFLK